MKIKNLITEDVDITGKMMNVRKCMTEAGYTENVDYVIFGNKIKGMSITSEDIVDELVTMGADVVMDKNCVTITTMDDMDDMGTDA